jgi:hypothetical protein
MPGTSRHDVEVMTTTGGTGYWVVTGSATIHAEPTVPAATEPARPAADAERRGGRAHHHA